MHSSRMHTACTSSCLRSLHQATPWTRHPPRTRHPLGPGTSPGPDPPVNRMTDRCKHITLPQTSFVGSNVTVVLLLLLTESFNVAVFTVYLVLINVNDLFTLTHFHLFQLDINSKYTYHVSADMMLNL